MHQSKPSESHKEVPPRAEESKKIHLTTLCYGDYSNLGTRLFESWLRYVDWNDIKDVRIGMNAISQKYRDVVWQYATRIAASGIPVFLVQEENNQNVYKYPMMRKLFYSNFLPALTGKFVWWWDDDGWIDATPKFWDGVKRAIYSEGNPELLGHVFYINLKDSQIARINAQPWVTTPIKPNHKVRFMQGGCWIAGTKFLRKWDYPFPELRHNGGDSILGLLASQQKITTRSLPKSIRSNDSKRRGETSAWVFESSEVANHDFKIHVTPVFATLDGLEQVTRSSVSAVSRGRIKTYN